MASKEIARHLRIKNTIVREMLAEIIGTFILVVSILKKFKLILLFATVTGRYTYSDRSVITDKNYVIGSLL